MRIFLRIRATCLLGCCKCNTDTVSRFLLLRVNEYVSMLLPSVDKTLLPLAPEVAKSPLSLVIEV